MLRFRKQQQKQVGQFEDVFVNLKIVKQCGVTVNVFKSTYTLKIYIYSTKLRRKLPFFGGIGRIYEASDKQSARFTVASIKDITNVIIPHFV
jgi:hypothetical protein